MEPIITIAIFEIGLVLVTWMAENKTAVSIHDFKGVLHPRPVFWLFMHFSQKLQHIGNK